MPISRNRLIPAISSQIRPSELNLIEASTELSKNVLFFFFKKMFTSGVKFACRNWSQHRREERETKERKREREREFLDHFFVCNSMWINIVELLGTSGELFTRIGRNIMHNLSRNVSQLEQGFTTGDTQHLFNSPTIL